MTMWPWMSMTLTRLPSTVTTFRGVSAARAVLRQTGAVAPIAPAAILPATNRRRLMFIVMCSPLPSIPLSLRHQRECPHRAAGRHDFRCIAGREHAAQPRCDAHILAALVHVGDGRRVDA